MNIVTLLDIAAINFKKSAASSVVTVEPFRPYVFSNKQLTDIQSDERLAKIIFRVSLLDPRLEPFHVNIPKKPGNNRLLLYNGGGGYGDQILTWPLGNLLHNLGYEVHVLSDPGNQLCWWGFPWVKSIVILPSLLEQIKLFDHHCLFQDAFTFDEEPDQEHAVDRLFHLVGINPSTIPEQLKVVAPNFVPGEMHRANQLFPGDKIAMYQLSASSPVRSLPPGDSVFLLKKLAEAHPDWKWLALHDAYVPNEYSLMTEEAAKEYKNIVSYNSQNLRELWILASRAEVVVGPDSMMVHVAGSMSVPCVGLWGPIHPGIRVKYYKRHIAIYHKNVCPSASCNTYRHAFPKICPRMDKRRVCECLAAISPDNVIEGIKRARA